MKKNFIIQYREKIPVWFTPPINGKSFETVYTDWKLLHIYKYLRTAKERIRHYKKTEPKSNYEYRILSLVRKKVDKEIETHFKNVCKNN